MCQATVLLHLKPISRRNFLSLYMLPFVTTIVHIVFDVEDSCGQKRMNPSGDRTIRRASLCSQTLLRIPKTRSPPIAIIHVSHVADTCMRIVLSKSQYRAGPAADLHAGVSQQLLLEPARYTGVAHPAGRWHAPAAPALFSSRSCSWLGQPLQGALCRQPGLLLHSPPLCRTTAAQPAPMLFSTVHAYRLEPLPLTLMGLIRAAQ